MIAPIALTLLFGCVGLPPEAPDDASEPASSSGAEATVTGLEDDSDAQTGASSGSSTTGESTSGSSSEDGGPSVCGDGRVQGQEDCDDANADELDGCTSLCERGPVGLEFGEIEETLGYFGGWVVPTFDEVSDCGPDEVLVGARGMFAYFFEYYVLAQVRGVCAPVGLVNAVPTTLEFGQAVELPSFGEIIGIDAFELVCPAGSVASGVFGASGLYIDRIGVFCRSLGLSEEADVVELGPPMGLRPFGTDLPEESSVNCSPGTVPAGLRVLGDEHAARLHLRCREIGVGTDL